MYYSVRGTLLHTEPGVAVIECGGVGYKCFTTFTTMSKLPAIGGEAMLYTFLHVKEDALDLFGFSDTAELTCFRQLLTVSGVGPKVALAILSDLTPGRLALAVVSGDAKTLTRCQGVGNKTAQRIVLELKDKMKGAEIGGGDVAAAASVGAIPDSNAGEAIAALVVLGYSQSEAAAAVGGLQPDLSVEDMIKHGLGALAGKV
ncbi:MAG: Holliday junction branch migration protein RuvA [Oscillospiraceae bacterium]